MPLQIFSVNLLYKIDYLKYNLYRPVKLTPEEEKIFTYQEFVDKDEVRGFFENLF